jgi:hypothetical protein
MDELNRNHDAYDICTNTKAVAGARLFWRVWKHISAHINVHAHFV